MDEPQSGCSFFVDDLIDAPLAPGDCIIWHQGEYIDLFDWPEHAVGDEQPPPSTGDLLLTDEPLAARHRWLESQGFERDDSMRSYTHSLTPCPVCNSDGHALFARWGEGYSVPSYLDQKTLEKPSWAPTTPGAVPPSDATDDTPQEEDDFDSPPEGEPRWLRVSSIAELKELPRFIGVRNKKPLVYTPNNDRSLLKGSTFSHKPAEDSKCGGFEDGIDAESFVREGGVCVDHVSIRKAWEWQGEALPPNDRHHTKIHVCGMAPLRGVGDLLGGEVRRLRDFLRLRLLGRTRHCRDRRGLSQEGC